MSSTPLQIEINGIPMAVDVSGSGPAIVFLHAGIADRRMWEPQRRFFAGDYRVISYDLRGFGETPLEPGPFSPRADLRDLLVRLGAAPAVIVGSSFGGKIALEAVVQYPEIARALVLVGAPLGGRDWGAAFEADEAEIEAACTAGEFERAAAVDLRLWVDGPYRTAADLEPAFREQARRLARHVYEVAVDVDARPEPLEPPAVERLGAVRVPTLVVVGELDQPAMREMAEVMANGIPGARLIAIPNAAHLPSLERPEVFNHILGQFLAGMVPTA